VAATIPTPVTKHSRSEQWKPVTFTEMKKFLGCMLLTGIIRKPKLEWYWSTRGVLLTPTFSQTMSRNRFQIIHQYLHFNDNTSIGTSTDRLYNIRPVLIFLSTISKTITFLRKKFHLMRACLLGGNACGFVSTILEK
jgi:hypothetical protein